MELEINLEHFMHAKIKDLNRIVEKFNNSFLRDTSRKILLKYNERDDFLYISCEEHLFY